MKTAGISADALKWIALLTMFFVRHGDSRLTPKGEEARV